MICCSKVFKFGCLLEVNITHIVLRFIETVSSRISISEKNSSSFCFIFQITDFGFAKRLDDR